MREPRRCRRWRVRRLAVETDEEEEIETPELEPAKSAEELNAEQLKEYLENLRPEDFGKFNL